MLSDHHSTVSPARRAATLDARRRLKMASSAHAYVRGSTVQFYRWLEGHGARAVPKGPAVWICGDFHAGNLGPLAAPDGKVHVQIHADFKHANVKASETIEIDTFCEERQIPPMYYEKPYYLAPTQGGDKVYSLLRQALDATNKVAVATFVMHQRQHLCAIAPPRHGPADA